MFLSPRGGKGKKISLKWVGIEIFLLCQLCVCSRSAVKPEPSAEELFNQGMKFFKGGKVLGFISTRDYARAAQIFQDILDKYPYSRFAPESQLRLADSYFFQKEYDSAILVYDEFQRLRPSHPEIPYVLYQLGESYFRQMLSIDRDQTAVVNAEKWFSRLVNNYPDSVYSSEARKKIHQCRVRLARREIYIGKFYLNRDDCFSALDRFQRVLTQYSDTGLADQALKYMAVCHSRIRGTRKAAELEELLSHP